MKKMFAVLAAGMFCLSGCGGQKEQESALPEPEFIVSSSELEESKEEAFSEPEPESISEPSSESESESISEPSSEPESDSVPESSSEPEPEAEPTPDDGIRPEIKEAIDEYEDFFDEYCAFMKEYEESDNAVTMLADYSRFLMQYAEMMSAMDEIGESDLNDAELLYYLEVMGRIEQKLLETGF